MSNKVILCDWRGEPDDCSEPAVGWLERAGLREIPVCQAHSEGKELKPFVEPCVFCRIAERVSIGDLPSNLVKPQPRHPMWVALYDIHPQAPTHIIVFPRTHEDRLTGAYPSGELKESFGSGALLSVVMEVAHGLGIFDYRVVINNGPGAGQQIMHLHAHLLAGWNKAPELAPGEHS